MGSKPPLRIKAINVTENFISFLRHSFLSVCILFYFLIGGIVNNSMISIFLYFWIQFYSVFIISASIYEQLKYEILHLNPYLVILTIHEYLFHFFSSIGVMEICVFLHIYWKNSWLHKHIEIMAINTACYKPPQSDTFKLKLIYNFSIIKTINNNR